MQQALRNTDAKRGARQNGGRGYGERKLKFSYKEQREYDTIDGEIKIFEEKWKSAKTAFLNGQVKIMRSRMEEDMAKEKDIKTNAMRILEKKKVPYEALQYECEKFIDGIHTAEKTGVPLEQSFKTLVLQGRSRQYYVFVLPVSKEVQLKAAAKIAGEKSLEMIPVKDITAVTGYVRGGCSPLGMKKQYPVFLHEDALKFEKIYISGGRIGSTLRLPVQDLVELTRAKTGEF